MPIGRAWISLLASAALVAVLKAGSAQAGTFSIPQFDADYVDIDAVVDDNGDFVRLEEGESVSGSFDIVLGDGDDFRGFLGSDNAHDVAGFQVGTESVGSARVSFLILDAFDFARDVAVIELGEDALQEAIVGPQVFFVHLASIDANFDVIAEINETGGLSWTVTAMDGVWRNDFRLAFGRLEVALDSPSTSGGPPGPTPMPEPGAPVLLAVGSLLVARAGRSRKA